MLERSDIKAGVRRAGEREDMKRRPKVYIQMFLSYLGMLLIPIVGAAVIYGCSSQAIREQAEGMNDTLLMLIQ